jgi:hypothetical protein
VTKSNGAGRRTQTVSARNIHHDAVVQALTKEGWTITDDPLHLRYGNRDLYVDLGAERSTIGAMKGEQRIAVETHSFLLPSPVRDIQEGVASMRCIARCWWRKIRAACSTSPYRAMCMMRSLTSGSDN